MTEVLSGREFVVGVDGSESSFDALRWALDEARLHGATVRIVHVRPIEDTEDAVLDAALHRVSPVEDAKVVVETRVEYGDPTVGLLDEAKGADLLVLGSRGRGGFVGLLLGSVSQQCAQHAPCPVVIVRSVLAPTDRRVVVGVDGSEESAEALRWAAEEARLRSSVLHVVHAWSVPIAGPHPHYGMISVEPLRNHARHVVQCHLGALGDDFAEVEIRRSVVAGAPTEVLIREAAGAELLVVGSRGRGGFPSLMLGSVSQQCAHHAPCPIAIIRPTS